MKKWIHASTKKSIKSSSDTRDRISYLQEKIEILKEYLARDEYEDPEDRIDDQMELEELEEQLNFAWQDDEAEYNYALQQQEFNPDGSLKGYDDYYDDTYSSTKVTASSEWAASWDKRSFSDGDSAPYYVMAVPSGTARVIPNDVDGTTYHAEIRFRNGDNRTSIAFENELDAMDWAEDMLFSRVTSSIECSSNFSSSLIPDSCKVYYKLDKEIDPEEINELTEIFAYSNLEFIAPLVAKSKWFDLLDKGDISYASLCKDSRGSYGVYSITSYGVVNITDRIPEVISKVKRDYY